MWYPFEVRVKTGGELCLFFVIMWCCATSSVECQLTCGEPDADRDGWSGGQEAGVHNGSH